MPRKKRYAPTHELSYGYWYCPTCQAEFYGGGPALHNTGCTEQGYEPCIYCYGPNENTRWIGAVVTEAEKQEATRDA